MAFRKPTGSPGPVARVLLPAGAGLAGLASGLLLWRRHRRKAVPQAAQMGDIQPPIRRGYYRRRRLWD